MTDDAGPEDVRSDPSRRDRRGFLVFGAAAVAVYAGTEAWHRFRRIPAEPIAGVPGMRRLGGDVTVTRPNPLAIELESGPQLSERAREAARAAAAEDPITARLHEHAFGPIPVTYFSAAGCPLCGTQSRTYEAMGIVPNLRPLALYGPASERAARAILAAAPVSQRTEESLDRILHDQLVGHPLRADDAAIYDIATDLIGAGAAIEVMGRMDTAQVDDALALNHALFERLGLPGTPVTVIGSTVAVGLTPRERLERIIEAEIQGRA